MAGTQLVRSSNAVPKVHLPSVVRKASCSRGWLRLVIQYLFGAITVASFVMIVMITKQTPAKVQDTMPSTCQLQSCRIVCNDTTPSMYEDVYLIVSESERVCPRLSLVFIDPIFDNGTLPAQWLSYIRVPLYYLSIIGGNLKIITPQAFMSPFAGSIEIIVLHGITITHWTTDTLVGLTSLRQLYIRKCNLVNVRRHALRAVLDTLDVLTITASGNWNPRNISGTAMKTLVTVDFSFNAFNDILSNVSFTGLEHTRFLYLNSCNITAIGLGTFDHLRSIEVIYLNDNLLISIPTGLFDDMMARINPQPRINLRGNPWHCDCDSSDLINLYINGLLYVDPNCDTPEKLHGKPFSAISNICTNDTYAEVIVVDVVEIKTDHNNKMIASWNNDCENVNSSNISWELITPNKMYSCEQNITLFSIAILVSKAGRKVFMDITKSDWIAPTYHVKNNDYAMVQISSLTFEDYGIVWFKTSCFNKIYCMSSLPKFLRVYDRCFDSDYTFCPFDLKQGFIQFDKCVNYNFGRSEIHQTAPTFGSLVLYICTSLVCLAFGAAFVYGIIRYNPVLLKGSKRLLFVKHKNVDALVLPPKVPLRSSLSNPDPDPHFNITKVWVLPENENNLSPRNFIRMKSTRSDKSTVSYISALQPTEDQLAEWRMKTHFDNNITMASDSEMSIISWINDSTSSSDYISSITYESLK